MKNIWAKILTVAVVAGGLWFINYVGFDIMNTQGAEAAVDPNISVDYWGYAWMMSNLGWLFIILVALIALCYMGYSIYRGGRVK